jgi:hypothetical protein
VKLTVTQFQKSRETSPEVVVVAEEVAEVATGVVIEATMVEATVAVALENRFQCLLLSS